MASRTGDEPASPPRMLRLELSEPLPDLDLPEGEPLYLLATYRGVPVAEHLLPGPGSSPQSAALLAALVLREAAPHIAFQDARQRLARRLGTAPPPTPVT